MSELLDEEGEVGRQVGYQIIQGLGVLVKDFDLHPKSSGKLQKGILRCV